MITKKQYVEFLLSTPFNYTWQDIFQGVAFFLAAITAFLFILVLGAWDASFSAIMAKRGGGSTGVGLADGTSESASSACCSPSLETCSRRANSDSERDG